MDIKTIEWADDLNTGISLIDEQHFGLIALRNDLVRAAAHHASVDMSRRITGELHRYAVMHFAEEERVMARHDHPMLGHHRRQHQGFIRTFRNMRLALNDLEFAAQVGGFLGVWIANHIKKEDQIILRGMASVPVPTAGPAF